MKSGHQPGRLWIIALGSLWLLAMTGWAQLAPARPRPRPRPRTIVHKISHVRKPRRILRHATIRLRSNHNCRIYLDHKYYGRISPDAPVEITTVFGRHLVSARGSDGRVWQENVHPTPEDGYLKLAIHLQPAAMPAAVQPIVPAQAQITPQPAPPEVNPNPPQPAGPVTTIQQLAASQAATGPNSGQQQAMAELKQQQAAAELRREQQEAAAAAYRAAQARALAREQAQLRAARLAHRRAVNAARPNGVVATNPKDGQVYIWVQSNNFNMGCVPRDHHCKANEKPEHAVSLSQGFWLGRTDVTVAAYARFVQATQTPMPPPPVDPNSKDGTSFDPDWSHVNRPIVDVKWQKAQAYCHWAGGRLPTEAEWEDAARAGHANDVYVSGRHISHDHANYGDNDCCKGKRDGKDKWRHTSPVDMFPANDWGFYDMAGDVWQWTRDYYQSDYYGISPNIDPAGPGSGGGHVERGGSWISPRHDLRISRRRRGGAATSADQLYDTGFRCALDWMP